MNHLNVLAAVEVGPILITKKKFHITQHHATLHLFLGGNSMLPNITLQYTILLASCKNEEMGNSIVELVELIPGCTTYTSVKQLLHVILDLLSMCLEEGVGTTVADECATFLVVCSDLQQNILPDPPSAVIVF